MITEEGFTGFIVNCPCPNTPLQHMFKTHFGFQSHVPNRLLTCVVQEIYRKGGRKFGFQNVAPMGCIPATMQRYNSSGCVKEPSAMGKLHNIALSKALQGLESQLEGFKYSIFDYYTALSERTNSPKKYGNPLLHFSFSFFLFWKKIL